MEIWQDSDLYWETNIYYQTQELASLVMDARLSAYYNSSSPDGVFQFSVATKHDETLSAYCDSSSPDGVLESPVAGKNIVSERKRRKKLSDKINALRVVVPKITKMDKASTIKDAISYIQELQEQETRIQAEISQLESLASEKNKSFDELYQQHLFSNNSGSCRSLPSPLQVIELRVSYMGRKTVLVSITCSKQRDTIVKLCEAFESLKLKVLMANITCSSETLSKTVFVEADEDEINMLRTKIESAIAALNFPESPLSC